MTLVEFLHARLDDDERGARLAQDVGDRWSAVTDANAGPGVRTGRSKEVQWSREIPYEVWHCQDELDGCPEDARGCIAEAEHIARHDPARVLRQAEALRRIVDDCAQIIGESSSASPEYGLAVAILKNVAAVDADHKDYQPEWRPE